jgi:hypothetical protein
MFKKGGEMTGEITGEKKENSTVLMTLYLLYKNHMITRRQLRDVLKISKDPWPDNLAEFLAKEAEKTL